MASDSVTSNNAANSCQPGVSASTNILLKIPTPGIIMVDSAAMLTGAEVAILNQARQQPEGARKRVRGTHAL